MKRITIILFAALTLLTASRMTMAYALPETLCADCSGITLPGSNLSAAVFHSDMVASRSTAYNITIPSIAASAPRFVDCTMYQGADSEESELNTGFRSYNYRAQDDPVGLRKADLLFPFNYFW